ncbi:MAG TPA: PIN domain-containing protein [Terriglobales bacterium]|nr:PIN domain-containing protein [Terriglobales bacterium]
MRTSAKAFLDTNIFVYAHDAADPRKQPRSRELIREQAASGLGVVSTQVMQDFFSAATRKLGIDPLAAKEILATFSVFEIVQVSPDLILEAIDSVVTHRISFWDSLLVAAAARAGCAVLYTEDLQSGRILRGITVRNPLTANHT